MIKIKRGVLFVAEKSRGRKRKRRGRGREEGCSLGYKLNITEFIDEIN